MFKRSVPSSLDLSGMTKRFLISLGHVRNVVIGDRAISSTRSSFLAVYVIITWCTSATANGHNTRHNSFFAPSFGRRFLYNISLHPTAVHKDQAPALRRMTHISNNVPINGVNILRERYHPNMDHNRNQPNNRIRLEGLDIPKYSLTSYIHGDIGSSAPGRQSVRPSFTPEASLEHRKKRENKIFDKRKSDIPSPSHPFKVLNPVLIQTYRAKSPCLRHETHWVRNEEDCSIFFVCARQEISAVLSCPSAHIWSNRVTNCVPINSRWDDCTPRATVATNRNRRRNRIPRRLRRIGHRLSSELPVTTTERPTTSTTEGMQETTPRSKIGKRLHRRRMMRRRGRVSGILKKHEQDLETISDSPKESKADFEFSTRSDPFPLEPSSTSPSSSTDQQHHPETRERKERRYRFRHRRKGLSKRKGHSHRLRFRQKSTSRKKWFVASSLQNETKVETIVKSEEPKRKTLPKKLKGQRKRYGQRTASKRKNEVIGLKRQMMHEQSTEIKNENGFDFPVKEEESEDGDNHVLDRWWKESVTVKPTTVATTQAMFPDFGDDVKLFPENKIEKVQPAQSQNSSRQKFVPECGVSSTSLIVGGLPISHDRWPWVASLRVSWISHHICGGTLVHPQWLITAAHCMADPDFSKADDWRVVFGDMDSAVVDVDLIMKHPDFVNGDNYPNDIAMLRLKQPVDVSGFKIRHACLPESDWGRTDWEKCWIMGWGEAKETFKSDLKELEVDIWKKVECSARWGWKRILNSHLCVGNGDSGACHGDSGGPLICRHDGYHYLTGVTSWGVSGCKTTGYPGVFTKVAYYHKWIHDVINWHTANNS